MIQRHRSVSLLRLAQSCKDLRAKLVSLLSEVVAKRRLFWEQESTRLHVLSDNGQALSMDHTAHDGDASWATGSLLPTTGTSSWRMRVCSEGFGGIYVGVCDAAARVSFGLCLYNGYVGVYSRSSEGNEVARVDSVSLFRVAHVVLEPQKFWWGLHLSQTHCHPWTGSRNEAMVDVRVDHDSGTISYVVNSRGPWDGVHPPDLSHAQVVGPFLRKGAELRLYAHLSFPNDRLTLEGPLWWRA